MGSEEWLSQQSKTKREQTTRNDQTGRVRTLKGTGGEREVETAPKQRVPKEEALAPSPRQVLLQARAHSKAVPTVPPRGNVRIPHPSCFQGLLQGGFTADDISCGCWKSGSGSAGMCRLPPFLLLLVARSLPCTVSV